MNLTEDDKLPFYGWGEWLVLTDTGELAEEIPAEETIADVVDYDSAITNGYMEHEKY